MRKGIEIDVSAADRARLEAIVADRNSPQKHVAGPDHSGERGGLRHCGGDAPGVSKPSVWRWQERFMAEGVDGLVHDKTRPARIPPLPNVVVTRIARRGAARRDDPLDGR